MEVRGIAARKLIVLFHHVTGEQRGPNSQTIDILSDPRRHQFEQRLVGGEFDLALVMTVNPGFGGQKMIMSSVEKIAEIRAMLDKAGCRAIVEVDGGVNVETAPMLILRGADMLVAGSALYGAPDARAFIQRIHEQYRQIQE